MSKKRYILKNVVKLEQSRIEPEATAYRHGLEI